MPSIILSKISWSSPDGRSVLSGLDAAFDAERTASVGRNGIGKSTLLGILAGDIVPTSSQVRVEGTVGVLRQSVQPNPAETIADLFGVTDGVRALQKAERGDASIEELEDADWSLPDRIRSSLAATGLVAEPEARLSELSGGQWTRACIASVIFAAPDFLILDEPTNNLDAGGRAAIVRLLAGWKSGAIVASHDRELLRHVDATVELTSLGATRYGGNWDFYNARKRVELAATEQRLAHAEKTTAEVDQRAQVAAERMDRHAAGGGRRNARGDLPRIVMGKRRDNSEISRGVTTRQMLRLKERSGRELQAARAAIEIKKELSLRLPRTNLPTDRRVLSVNNVTAGCGSHVVFRDLSLSVVGPERIGILGRNGTGKSTLLRLLTGQLCPLRGTVAIHVDFAMLDQNVSCLDRSASIIENFRRMNPNSTEHDGRDCLASFGFRGDAGLQRAGELSGGQMLRAGLACVFGAGAPSLMMLDEPTNHLDLDTVRALEAVLLTFDGALVVVSHDGEFLRSIGVGREISMRC